MLVDAHAHLDLRQYDDDRAETVARAKADGVERIINVGINSAGWNSTLALARQYPGYIYVSLGLHPNDIAYESDPQAALDQLKELIKANPGIVIGVGETGLDYYHDDTPAETQKSFFLAQIALAREVNLPLVIHCRDAMRDVIDTLSEHARHMPIMMHCFSGTVAEAEECLSLGTQIYISIAGPVTFKNAHDRHQVVHHVPLDRLLTETDCPFLTPHPFRGKRNEPARVKLIAAKIAEIKSISYDTAIEQLGQNVKNLFKLT